MDQTIGRPVRIASICFRDGSQSIDTVTQWVEAEAARGVDLIALPESWPGHDPEPLDGPAVTAMARLERAALRRPWATTATSCVSRR